MRAFGTHARLRSCCGNARQQPHVPPTGVNAVPVAGGRVRLETLSLRLAALEAPATRRTAASGAEEPSDLPS
jgi:hypothetical protein